MSEDLLQYLDPEQRRVATALGGAVVVRAGAGSGKTRAMTYRIAHGVTSGAYDPRHVMALTFTSRAAGELRSRLADLGVRGVAARTFHSAALSQLTYFWPTAIGGRIPELKESKLPYVAEAACGLGLPADRASIKDLAAEIEWARVSLVDAQAYPDAAVAAGHTDIAGCAPADIARLLTAYQEVKERYYIIDFEDVLVILIGVLLSRPDILRQVRDQYRHFIVDEFQDVSPAQYRLLRLWVGDNPDLCVVGDVSQTIYSFAGARSQYLANFPSYFAGAREFELIRDYRSTPQVVECANTVIAEDTSAGAVRLVSQVGSSVPVSFVTYDDDVAEANGIAENIRRLHEQGISYGDMAILYRTNAQSAEFERVLGEAGITYSIRGAERFFQRREVREAMVSLRSVARSGAEGPLVSTVKAALLQSGWREVAPEAAGAARDAWESLATILRMAEHMAAAREATLIDFVEELEERARSNDAPAVDGVTLASLHAAKGLEWEAVYLAGMSEGLMPISLASNAEAVAEERRLLYVGITRAKTHLQISYAESNGRRGKRKRSRFLEAVWPKPVKTSRRASKEEAARQFENEHEADLPLYEALVEWRKAVAQEAGRPAYVVFHDTVLRSIAIHKPQTLAELGRLRGIGPDKLRLWGDEVLGLVKGFTA